MSTVVDFYGDSLTSNKIPQRIVSLVPSQTELLYDLGLENALVGITKFCIHPFHLKSTKTVVGGTKKVNFQKIKNLYPDIIIANKEENTHEMVSELSQFCPVIVTDIKTLSDNNTMILTFGKLFNKRVEANKIVDKINFAHADFLLFITSKPIKKVVYFIWKNPYMIAGKDTFINHLLEMNRFENTLKEKGRYPEIDVKKLLLEADPDVIFLSSEPYPFKEEDTFEIGRYTHHAKCVFVNGELFSWFGSRMTKAFDYFKQIHSRI